MFKCFHFLLTLGVINTWLDTLLDFIEFLPVDCLQREVTNCNCILLPNVHFFLYYQCCQILPFAIERSDLSKPESLRLISCRIFGSLAPKLNAYM